MFVFVRLLSLLFGVLALPMAVGLRDLTMLPETNDAERLCAGLSRYRDEQKGVITDYAVQQWSQALFATAQAHADDLAKTMDGSCGRLSWSATSNLWTPCWYTLHIHAPFVVIIVVVVFFV